MGMATELQRHPLRHAHRDVGLVRQQHDRRVVGYFRKRRCEIVDADAPHRPEAPRRKIRQLIAEPGQPERSAGFGQAFRVVFVNRNASGFERAAAPLVLLKQKLGEAAFADAATRVQAELRARFGDGAFSLDCAAIFTCGEVPRSAA